MQCPECQFENREDATFCLKCGENLEVKCSQCGRSLPAEALFCSIQNHKLGGHIGTRDLFGQRSRL